MAGGLVSCQVFDIIIIGGGISGLYTAWRLAKSTKLKILVLEATDRFGGRFKTCEMPGGFPADLGAMRYGPARHHILHQLITELDVKTSTISRSVDKEHDGPNTEFKAFLRNQQLTTLDDFKRVYSIGEEELPHFLAANQFNFPEYPKEFEVVKTVDGNIGKYMDKRTGQLAQDMSVAHYLSQFNNVELLNFGKFAFPALRFQLAVAMGAIRNRVMHPGEVRVADKGFENIISKLVLQLASFDNVVLKQNEHVESITEDRSFFLRTNRFSDSVVYNSQKVIYACSEVGLRTIQFNSYHNRSATLQKLLSNVKAVNSFKLYLTYSRAWWEEYGLFQGTILTDLPINHVTIFGNHSKRNSYATIMAAYSVNDHEYFQGLDHEHNERFVNKAGDISKELIPSKLLVDSIQDQLKKVVGCTNLQDQPVCAVRALWGTETRPGVSYCPKVGVDSNQLNWDSIKPFDDADIFITGDTFPAWDTTGLYMGHTEGALLTSERILVKHFGLQPYIKGLCLQNPWPLQLTSKL